MDLLWFRAEDGRTVANVPLTQGKTLQIERLSDGSVHIDGPQLLDLFADCLANPTTGSAPFFVNFHAARRKLYPYLLAVTA